MLGLPYTIEEIGQSTLALDLFQGFYPNLPITQIAYDSRNISQGANTIFVALKTSHRDGHDFIEDAIQKGVKNFLVDRPLPFGEVNYAICQNTLESLQFWAARHRQRFHYPVIGITGSNGKTTVKEWIATLLEQEFQIVKSPMSYNSQLGVALSLLQMRPGADLAIIEAGISKPGEMEILKEMIQPDIGILTHMGTAHAEGFESEAHKLSEKSQLFEEVKVVITGSGQEWVLKDLQGRFSQVITVGGKENDTLRIANRKHFGNHTSVELTDGNQQFHFDIPFSGPGDESNALLAILVAHYLKADMEMVQNRVKYLHPISMRLEIITDNPEMTIINDSYNSDIDSVRNAFHYLMRMEGQPGKKIIISDIPNQGKRQKEIQQKILDEAIGLVGKNNVYTVGPVFGQLDAPHHYEDTSALIENIFYDDFIDSTVLLKGARPFEFEKIIPLLNRKLNATYFKIDLNLLSHNYRYLKSLLPEDTKTMCMVKAASYGSGTWEIAQALIREGADYLTVAYASEGIELRKANITAPIMVMNPDPISIDALIKFHIEPEISNFDFLERYLRAAHLVGLKDHGIHLKIETGMGRLGFVESDIDRLIQIIHQYPDLKIISVMSHLAASDVPEEDEFSLRQIRTFQNIYQKLQQELGIFSLRHILNTAGILRFPEYAMDMARLGIGLYGIDPTGENHPLEEIGSLHSTVSQIRTYPVGTSIGYGRSQFADRETRIATVPVGYADGIPRSLSNGKMSFLIRGKRAPIFGRVCMDMIMLDVTDIPEAEAGDEVVLIGRQGDEFISVVELAEAAGTIPYEILVRISPRVRRVYGWRCNNKLK
ncbi:MAG: bifunctional UDP-N-acetylmuramoyl-tripeptide:D-alanyl-D-alanine ligase/alanine racemase [Bacteroidia bacterium]